MSDGEEKLAPIVKLVTSAELDEKADEVYADDSSDAAIEMLEAALADLRARPRGQRCTAVAIAMAFEDGAYGSRIPSAETPANGMGHLVGALADAQFRLLRRNETR